VALNPFLSQFVQRMDQIAGECIQQCSCIVVYGTCL